MTKKKEKRWREMKTKKKNPRKIINSSKCRKMERRLRRRKRRERRRKVKEVHNEKEEIVEMSNMMMI